MAAGLKIAFDAAIRKAHLLRVSIEAIRDLPLEDDGLNLARQAALKVVEMAEALRAARPLAPSNKVIDVGGGDDGKGTGTN